MFRRKDKNVYDQPNEQNKKLLANVGKGTGIVLLVFLAVYLLFGSVYSLKENEYMFNST